jgi:hypothetical protein
MSRRGRVGNTLQDRLTQPACQVEERLQLVLGH